jgi:hypothetical protein
VRRTGQVGHGQQCHVRVASKPAGDGRAECDIQSDALTQAPIHRDGELTTLLREYATAAQAVAAADGAPSAVRRSWPHSAGGTDRAGRLRPAPSQLRRNQPWLAHRPLRSTTISRLESMQPCPTQPMARGAAPSASQTISGMVPATGAVRRRSCSRPRPTTDGAGEHQVAGSPITSGRDKRQETTLAEAPHRRPAGALLVLQVGWSRLTPVDHHEMDIQVAPRGQFRAAEETGKAVVLLVLVLQQLVLRGEGGAAGYTPHLTHRTAFLLAHRRRAAGTAGERVSRRQSRCRSPGALNSGASSCTGTSSGSAG